MIFENLLVNNFGVYSGKQNFDLTTDKKKPVILIGAMNGSGKTTFLQAIDFVLYGKFSNIFQSQKLSYENFLKKNINKENFDHGAQIELVFFRKFKGKNQKFKLSRNWKPNGNKIKEEFFVFINDVYDEDITKDWDNFCLQGNMALNTLTAGWSYMQNAGMSYGQLSTMKTSVVNKMKNLPPFYKSCTILY